MAVKRVPDGYRRVTPHLTVRDAPAMIEFYKKAFGAVEKRRAPGPDGKSIMHAELQIGDSIIFLNDEFPEMGALSPLAAKGTAVTLHLYVEDADKQFHPREHTALEGAIRVRNVHFHRHGPRARVQSLDDARHLAGKDPARIGIRTELGGLADLDKRHVFLDYIYQDAHGRDVLHDQNPSR